MKRTKPEELGIVVAERPDVKVLVCNTLPGKDPETLVGILKKFRPKRYFEFGFGAGASTETVRKTCPDCEIYSIDIIDSLDRWRPKEFGTVERVNFIRANSHVWQVPKEMEHSFDMVWTDADHSLASVGCNTAKAFQLVRPDGIILWHDINDHRDECKEYEYFEKYANELPVHWLEGSSIGLMFAKEMQR